MGPHRLSVTALTLSGWMDVMIRFNILISMARWNIMFDVFNLLIKNSFRKVEECGLFVDIEKGDFQMMIC